MDYKKKYEELKKNIRKAVSEIHKSGEIAYETSHNKELDMRSRYYAQGKASGLFIADTIVEELLREDNE